MNNIKRYRGLKGLSQKQLSDILGISRTGLNLMENGKIWIIKPKTLKKMCETLGVTPTQLLGPENFKYVPETQEDINYMIEILKNMAGN